MKDEQRQENTIPPDLDSPISDDEEGLFVTESAEGAFDPPKPSEVVSDEMTPTLNPTEWTAPDSSEMLESAAELASEDTESPFYDLEEIAAAYLEFAAMTASAEEEEDADLDSSMAELEDSNESEETARFIQEQVQSALGNTYSEETLRAQEERAAQFRAERERTAKQEARRQRRLERRKAIRAFFRGHGAEPEQEELPSDNVIQMPVSPLKPIRDKIHFISDKVDDYAEGMYGNAEEPEVEEEEGTASIQQVKTKSRRFHKISHTPPEPDIPPSELARRYNRGLRNMRSRIGALAILCAVMLVFTLYADGLFPVSFLLKGQSLLVGGILSWCLALACLLALDVLWMGLAAFKRFRLGTHTLAAFAALFTLADSVWYTIPGREGGLPLAAPAALCLLGALWGIYDRKKALAKTCSTVCLNTTPYRVTLDQDRWKGESAFCKELGTTAQFGSQIQSPDGAMRLYRYFVPLILLAVIIGSILSSVGTEHPQRLIWCLSVMLIAAAPLSGMLAFSQPFLRLTKRLGNTGAIAGWDGALSMEEDGETNVLLRDEDLFPPGSVTAQGIRTFQDMPLERVTSCTASMIQASGSGLTRLFTDLLQVQGGFFRRVDSLSQHEAGGMVANIRGDQVMIGTAGFMSVMHIPLKQGEYVKEGIFCAINGQLQGIFTLRYEQSRAVGPSFQALLQAGVRPVLVTRDFNITPAMLHRRFKLPVNKMEYPNVRRRHELSEPGQPHNPVLGALVRREGLGPFADTIIGARRLCRITRVNTGLAVAASIIGTGLTAYLTYIAAFLSLSPLNMTLFLLLWLVPNLLISRIVDKF